MTSLQNPGEGGGAFLEVNTYLKTYFFQMPVFHETEPPSLKLVNLNSESSELKGSGKGSVKFVNCRIQIKHT